MSDTRVYHEGSWRDAKGSKEGRTLTVDGGEIKTYETTGAAAISKATTIRTDYDGRPWKLRQLEVTFSAAPTTAGNMTVTKTALSPNKPDTLLFSTDPSATSATSVVQIWEDGGLLMESTDEVTLAYANTNTKTYKAIIVCEVL